jgi:hypothetical protein
MPWCAAWFVCNFVCKLSLPAHAYPAKTDELDGNYWVSF